MGTGWLLADSKTQETRGESCGMSMEKSMAGRGFLSIRFGRVVGNRGTAVAVA